MPIIERKLIRRLTERKNLRFNTSSTRLTGILKPIDLELPSTGSHEDKKLPKKLPITANIRTKAARYHRFLFLLNQVIPLNSYRKSLPTTLIYP
jgi:hypothetical protein